MPCSEGQMTSGEYFKGLKATKDYAKNEAIVEKNEITDIKKLRSAIHDVKGLLLEARVAIGENIDAEISHHYGITKFREIGCTILNIINREYCKKIIIVLPGQAHPTHYHAIKEETFQLLYGDLECVINGTVHNMKPGDIMTVMRYDKHSFASKGGAIFEEVSTTHIKGDSYYEDPEIMKCDYMDRKTILKEW
jgi:N-acetylneuraminate synthase